ncbi:MAG: hypothetical protein IT430_12795 [Phycisphaerales bacterium]|nr:hypothetical protein [Phycisphaerales bacterium]
MSQTIGPARINFLLRNCCGLTLSGDGTQPPSAHAVHREEAIHGKFRAVSSLFRRAGRGAEKDLRRINLVLKPQKSTEIYEK